MRVVTTCHKEGFEKYGHRLLETWSKWPIGAELYFYAEGFDIPHTPGVTQRKLPNDLLVFKERYQHYEAHSYLFDVVRFSNKVFAAIDALFDYKGLGVWLDADCVTFEAIPEDLIRKSIPKDCYMSLFKRAGMYSETGFWIMDCSHPQHQEFLMSWKEWYLSSSFKYLDNWTDCETLDATLRKMEREGLVKTHSLSGEHEKDMHPMAYSEIGKYIDHCKGSRKEAGFSPENKNHKV